MDLSEYEVGSSVLNRLQMENERQDRERQEAIEAKEAADYEALQREPTAIIESLLVRVLSLDGVISSARHNRRREPYGDYSGSFPLLPFTVPGDEEPTLARLQIDTSYSKKILIQRGPKKAAADAISGGCELAIVLQSPGYEPNKIHFNMATSNFGDETGEVRDLSTAGLCGPTGGGQPEFFKAMMREVAGIAGLEVLPLPGEAEASNQPVASTV